MLTSRLLLSTRLLSHSLFSCVNTDKLDSSSSRRLMSLNQIYQQKYLHLCTCKSTLSSSSPRLCFSTTTETSQHINEPSSSSNSGTQSDKSSRWSRWTGRNSWKPGLLVVGLSLGSSFLYILYNNGPPPVDDSGNVISDEYSHLSPSVAYFCRAFGSMFTFYQAIRDPPEERLLPDALPYPYQPPYTLVFEIDGLLLHGDWTFRTGWRFKKRPGLQVFLEQLVPYYEIVLYTRKSGMVADPVLRQLDPEHRYIHYRLYRECTRYRHGHHIKDLSCLNRDLSKVIFVDWDPQACQLQPRNCFLMKKWAGDEADRDLIDLIAFLRMLAINREDDLRDALDVYREFTDPLAEFRSRHNNLIESLKHKEETKQQQKSSMYSFSFSGFRKG